MLSWRRVKGGVEKTHSWGLSAVYAENFEDCFTDKELLVVSCDLENIDIHSPEFERVKIKLKKRLVEVERVERRKHG